MTKYILLLLFVSIISFYGCSIRISSGTTSSLRDSINVDESELPPLIVKSDEEMLGEILNSHNKKLVYIWWSADCLFDATNLKQIMKQDNLSSYVICLDYNTDLQQTGIRELLYSQEIKDTTYLLDHSMWKALLLDLKNYGNTEEFVQNFIPDFEIKREAKKEGESIDFSEGHMNFRIPVTILLDEKNNVSYYKAGDFVLDSLQKYISQ